jgi:hypothetical protein
MTNYVVDNIGTVVASMREVSDGPPYYMYGHKLEISNRLLEKDLNKEEKYKKYPLIALRLDTSEYINNGIVDYNLNIAILEYTKSNYNAEERYQNVFKPILYPLYTEFINKLKLKFYWPGNQKYPPHTKVDRPYWGTEAEQQNIKNIFNDPLDAIEIINLKISQTIKNC